MHDKELATELMKTGDFAYALPLLQRLIQDNPKDWSVRYMAGQCCRFLDDFSGAVQNLTVASSLNPDESPVFHALGIAHQCMKNFPASIDPFRRALELDPDNELAFNSLAMTQKLMGELDLALHNYDAGAKALTRRIVKSMENSFQNKIYKDRDTPQHLWSEYALFGATYLCSISEQIASVAWLTGEQAIEEEETESHGGSYWVDTTMADGKDTRCFLPNYFNTFREMLRLGKSYSSIIGNRGTVLSLLGRKSEAEKHFQESEYFNS
jgi:tetratricopeptide (TPR) repeat protein